MNNKKKCKNNCIKQQFSRKTMQLFMTQIVLKKTTKSHGKIHWSFNLVSCSHDSHALGIQSQTGEDNKWEY